MKKSYIRELILWIVIIIFLTLIVIECFENLLKPIENMRKFNVLFIGLLILIVLFIINYIIRVIKTENKKRKKLLLIMPIIGIVFSSVFVNGVNDADFLIINLIGIILEICMILLYNLYAYYYFEPQANTFISLILYNIISIVLAIKGTGIFYLHHYYLGMLIIIIPLSIIEMLIRSRKLHE